MGGGPGKLWHEGGRVDAESLIIVPNFGTGQGAQWWNPTDPGEMVVGVEDSFNLAANNLVRFRWGRGGQYADVPGAAAVLRGSCAPNHGPKALVYMPPLYGSGLPAESGSRGCRVLFVAVAAGVRRVQIPRRRSPGFPLRPGVPVAGERADRRGEMTRITDGAG